ncbi:MAG: 3',5'-cyclic-nucleotide phosphodiesterase [uncultured Solirubrobacteraceae bacterium]|uniref:3',5'-cyclic-nucleotide phosphodiesterase n=1 Tax=uncultured Solirubrobacteraceae bacterium TaxID=1162706 RepID=A0A6J4SYH6_9ACTN|nr:MAG: 3',5'-cyclic-nucleotide phosphodiesterase [uncultured Solirubrobacteraceae bacterium]
MTRHFLIPLLLCAGLTSGCDAAKSSGAAPSGSTLVSTVIDADGDARLERGPGEPLKPRRELLRSAPADPTAAAPSTFAQITDLHIRDEESPARVTFLDRVGEPFTSTFRPHEALSHQVATATVRALNSFDPQAVVVTGDLIDSAQSNELDDALAVLDGGQVRPDSGARGYDGVQEASNPDPLYYRPDSDAPRRPGLLERAQAAFESPGLDAPWLPVLGNHDVLVQGEVAPSASLDAAARDDRVFESLQPGAEPPTGDEDPAAAVEALLDGRIPARERRVPADPDRRHLTPAETARRLGRSLRAGRLDYTADVGDRIRAVVLDTARREGGSGGVVSGGQVAWLREQVARAGRRWLVVFSHHSLETSDGGEAALAVLDAAPRVAAAVSGHRHYNSIEPRETARAGYWLVSTASLADFPQQARAFSLRELTDGGAVLETWMVDHDGRGLAGDARALSFIDAQGGRPRGASGTAADRNAALHLPPAA